MAWGGAAVGGQQGKIGDTTQIEQQAINAGAAKQQFVAKRGQRGTFVARRHVLLPKIGKRDDAREPGQVVAIADLQRGVVRKIGPPVLVARRVPDGLAVAGQHIDSGGRYLPALQAGQHGGSVAAGYFRIQQY